MVIDTYENFGVAAVQWYSCNLYDFISDNASFSQQFQCLHKLDLKVSFPSSLLCHTLVTSLSGLHGPIQRKKST